MKKTKLLLTALCVGSVLSCTKDSDLSNDNAPVEVTLEAFSGEDNVETKTVRQSDGSTWWADGDQISLFFGNGNNGGSCFTTATGGETASFSGTLNAFTAGGEGYAGETTYFWGVYPYSTSNTCDNNSVTLNIPSVQPGVAGTFGPGVNISVGRSENLKMGFYNVCSGFSFSVSTEGITELMFKTSDDTPIVGDATVEFVTGKPAVTSLTNSSSEIHIFPEGGTFEVGQKYYLEFIPTTLDGFTVTIYNNKGKEASYEYTSSRTFQRGMFTSISNVDTRVGEWTARKGIIAFADPNFKAYCVSKFDTDNDGEISYEEAIEVKSISYNFKSATTLDEICFFTSLEKLECFYNQLTSLDVSNNTALTELSCAGNQLTSLDVSNNTALTRLSCQYNQITDLDVSSNTVLAYLDCGTNQLTSLDVTNNTVLTSLGCGYNQLTSLDVSNNTDLNNLQCDNNQIMSLDVSNNTALTSLECSKNQLSELDITHNTALIYLYSFGNKITSLDVCSNTALTVLDFRSNKLTSLDLSNNASLTELSCEYNQLTSLDVSNNTSLTFLDCSPMNDENGLNLLKTLYIYNGQNIEGVTSNRNQDYIPNETVITDSNPGSGEGTGEEELGDEDNLGYVDLGLSVKWAKCNLGASSAEECGLYYQWGDTTGYGSDVNDGKYFGFSDRAGRVSYKWCNGTMSNVTKYYGDDGKTVLDQDDDAAHVSLGGSWRMPTVDEWSELLNSENCSWTWTTYKGVSGCKVQSKKPGYTNNWIFLPASGLRSNDSLEYFDAYGYYWASSRYSYTSSYQANYVGFYSPDVWYNGNWSRAAGLSIRPVLE